MAKKTRLNKKFILMLLFTLSFCIFELFIVKNFKSKNSDLQLKKELVKLEFDEKFIVRGKEFYKDKNYQKSQKIIKQERHVLTTNNKNTGDKVE